MNIAAHHIIPATHKDAKDARNILSKYGIDINDDGIADTNVSASIPIFREGRS